MCMRPAHCLLGAYAGAAAALVGHQPWPVVAASAVIGAVAGPGPDVDQHGWWRRLDRWVPDEWLGEGGPLQHRGITHFWGLPVAVAAYLYVGGGPWWAWAALAGWASHLLGDALFGRRAWGRGPGIPMFGMWWGHRGLGLDTGGFLESCLKWVLILAAGPLLVSALHP